MKTSVKKVTREEFLTAINFASQCIEKLHPKTKLAYCCGRFLELNKLVSKKNNKDSKLLTADLNRELSDFMVDHALEKDGKLWLDEKGNYQYSKSGDKLVKNKQQEVSDKIEQIIDPFLQEKLEVSCIISEVVLPDNIKQSTIDALNGFVFKYVSEFHEEIETIEEKSE